MGRTGQKQDGVSAAALLYGRKRSRIVRDRYVDEEHPGERARHRATKIIERYRDGDLRGFVFELQRATGDPERIPDEKSPLLLDIYRAVIGIDLGKEAAHLGLEEDLGEAEVEGMAYMLVPQLHHLIRGAQSFVEERDRNSREAFFGSSILRRGDIEDAAYRVEGKLSDHYCGRLQASDNVLLLSPRSRASFLEGEVLPAARSAFAEAMRRFVIVQANAPTNHRGWHGESSEKMERSGFAVYGEGDGKVHLAEGSETTLCGCEVRFKAQIGSWRDVNYPGSIHERCRACGQRAAGSALIDKAEAERSDHSPRLEGHPALGGRSVKDFLDQIANSPEVMAVLRESVEPGAERSYEKLCLAVRRKLVGIEPLG